MCNGHTIQLVGHDGGFCNSCTAKRCLNNTTNVLYNDLVSQLVNFMFFCHTGFFMKKKPKKSNPFSDIRVSESTVIQNHPAISSREAGQDSDQGQRSSHRHHWCFHSYLAVAFASEDFSYIIQKVQNIRLLLYRKRKNAISEKKKM
jgi:hypothetical protein